MATFTIEKITEWQDKYGIEITFIPQYHESMRVLTYDVIVKRGMDSTTFKYYDKITNVMEKPGFSINPAERFFKYDTKTNKVVHMLTGDSFSEYQIKLPNAAEFLTALFAVRKYYLLGGESGFLEWADFKGRNIDSRQAERDYKALIDDIRRFWNITGASPLVELLTMAGI